MNKTYYREPGAGYELGIKIREAIDSGIWLAGKLVKIAVVLALVFLPSYLVEKVVPEIWNSLPPTVTSIFE